MNQIAQASNGLKHSPIRSFANELQAYTGKSMGKQADELKKKFGGNYTFEELIQSKVNFDLAKIKYEYPGSVKGNNFTELEEIAKDGKADAKKAIKLLLQLKRLNEKSGQN